MKLYAFLLGLYAIYQKMIHQKCVPIYLDPLFAFFCGYNYCGWYFVLVELPQQFVGQHLCCK